MKNRACFLLVSALAVPMSLSAADEVISGDLLVERNLAVLENVEIGEASLGAGVYPAFKLFADSFFDDTFVDQVAFGSNTAWVWSQSAGAGFQKLMQLETGGKVSLFKANDPTTPTIVLNGGAAIPVVTIAGKKVLTEGNLVASLATVDWPESLALGYEAFATEGAAAFALGPHARAEGELSIAIGDGQALGEYAIALGLGTSAEGNYSTALGMGARTHASGAVALGSSHAYGRYSLALGDSTLSQGHSSTALGWGTQTAEDNQVALGTFNDPAAVPGAAFMLGNGTVDESSWTVQRSNLFVIMKDGRGIFRSTGYVEPTPENPAPEQPEALTVEGAMTVKGDLKLMRRQGDIGMGSFGRPEDQSPSN